ncbi:hypothetical protein PWT90_09234 [Aphanocladium album]|nr:hypothetical protein PWT90_09234 [Aphanocladium album]
MQTKIVLASLVAAVSADNLLAMRQAASPFGNLSKQCSSDLVEVQSQSDLPSIPTEFIQDAVQAIATLTNPCDYTPTGSVAAAYTSFISAAESWASKHTSIASKIEKDCSAALQDIGQVCPTNSGASKPTSGSDSGSGGSKTTSGSGSGSSSEATGTTTSGGPAKATGDGKSAAANGPVAAGALMVAALGAVALL